LKLFLAGNPITVRINHIDDPSNPTRLPVNYAAYDNEDEADDPNDITYPGRREREETTRSSRAKTSKIPSFSDVIRTFVTTALNPTTPHPNHDKRSTNTVLYLMAAYSAFFAIGLLILVALILTMVIKRRRKEQYKTYIIKKSQKF
jgi:hypothetical protein